jgi:hypothetical protein
MGYQLCEDSEFPFLSYLVKLWEQVSFQEDLQALIRSTPLPTKGKWCCYFFLNFLGARRNSKTCEENNVTGQEVVNFLVESLSNLEASITLAHFPEYEQKLAMGRIKLTS